jgi:pimeloyl-ACP methyl ester carboxylesterase
MEKYTIVYNEASWQQLKKRVAESARLPSDLNASSDAWEYGIPTKVMQELLRHWTNDFDWPVQVAKLNSYPQFVFKNVSSLPPKGSKAEKLLSNTRNAGVEDAIDMHFVHLVMKDKPSAKALVFLHGWPGSWIEFCQVLNLLKNSQLDYDVIVPSLPGFTHSSPPKNAGFGLARMATTIRNLLTKLGYKQFVVQGGDWGSMIARYIALLFPTSTLAIHLNMNPCLPPMPHKAPLRLARIVASQILPVGIVMDAEESSWVSRTLHFQKAETGYQAIQSTKPQTISYAMLDSPVGLLAWIAEKFHAWSDNAELPFGTIETDDLLTNVTMYYMTRCYLSSARIYFEALGPVNTNADATRILGAKLSVPVGVANFRHEMYKTPREWSSYYYNLVHWTIVKGGHFAALEQPKLFLDDVQQFLSKIA